VNAPRLSLILPVYNVAAYLPACLARLAALTPAADEIIAVDDGSTDSCPAILADWQARLPRMRVIRQENGGLSAARNTGLRYATGKWLAFVDSDDLVLPDAYGRLLALAEADDLDMAVMNADYHFEGRAADYPIYRDLPSSPVMSGADWLKERLAAGRFLHMVWMHLYRREFLTAHRFGFVPGLIHEDVIWTTEVLLAARRMRYDAQPGYRYRIPLRHFSPEQKALRLAGIIASSIYNTRALDKIATTIADRQLARLMRYDLVDKGFAVFHKIEQLAAPDRRRHRATLREVGYFGLLWRNAGGARQYRRIVRYWLRSLLP
jgi:glycosyltransferase involved in cell wall biosynthesis